MTRPPYAPWNALRKIDWGSQLPIVLPCTGDEVAFVSSITKVPDDETKHDVLMKAGILSSVPQQKDGEDALATVTLNSQEDTGFETEKVRFDDLRILPKKTSPAVRAVYLARARAYIEKNPKITISESTLAEFVGIISTTVDFCVSNAIGAKQHEIFAERVEAHFHRNTDLPEGPFFKETIMKVRAPLFFWCDCARTHAYDHIPGL